MRVSKYIHSCVLVESGGTKILFDPGKFSFLDGRVKAESFAGLSAIVITHQHLDHVDPEALAKIVANNRSAPVIASAEIGDLLAKSGLDAEVMETGSRTIGACTIEAIPAEHAPLLNTPQPRNIAYVVDGAFLHPGDSFDRSLDARRGIALLALPVMAPWTTELAVAEFAGRLAPKKILPIHDGYAKDFFLDSRYQNYGKYFEGQGMEFVGVREPGEGVEV
jgi:L-ascorbate metabolism protein UlaG (beta-lactamase superfamily)